MDSRLTQLFRFQFNVCLNTIAGARVHNNNNTDGLYVVWKTRLLKGRLGKHSVKLVDENASCKPTTTLNMWCNHQLDFEETLSLDFDTQTFEPDPITFQLKCERKNYTETLGEFRMDLSSCVSMVLSENVFSMDIPSKTNHGLSANVTIQFKLLGKSEVKEAQAASNEPQGIASLVQSLKDEIARVSNESSTLSRLFIDSQSFSKADYWLEKLPDMEVRLREYTTKLNDLDAHVSKTLHETKITVLDDKITDLQTKFFSEQEKLRRLADIYNAFSQSTAQELAKVREKTAMGLAAVETSDSSPPGRVSRLGVSLGMPHKTLIAPPSPGKVHIPEVLDLASASTTPGNSPSLGSFSMDMELRAKLAQVEELRIRIERMESETQQLWPRLALDEADAQQLHLIVESLKWEREKDMENFYMFQKSQLHFAEEVTKLKLQLSDCQSHPRKLEQKVELLEAQTGKIKRLITAAKLSGMDELRTRSTPSLGRSWTEFHLQQLSTDHVVTLKPTHTKSHASHAGAPYHWFLLDHCFLFACDGEPAADLLVPAFFLVRFCLNNLDLAGCKDDWAVFDGLFFALHFEVKKHFNSSTHLLFWLSNTSFILEQLNESVFSQSGTREVGVEENAQTIKKELENFIKMIYLSFAGFLAQVFESAVKSFSLCSAGDYENEWVTTILAKLDWLHGLLKSYQFQDSFSQQVIGDVYGVMDSTLFNLICSESPARANQVKFFLSAVDNWACSVHPSHAKIIDKLSHIREAANLILAPKGNLRDASFRKSLFPHLTDLQHKHLLTIFIPDTNAEKLPPTLLAHLSAQITNTPTQDSLEHRAILTSYTLGEFFKPPDQHPPTVMQRRFSPPLIEDAQAGNPYSIVNAAMSDVEAILARDGYAHWGYLSRELEKWYGTL